MGKIEIIFYYNNLRINDMSMIHPNHNTNDITTSILRGLTISIDTDAFITIKNEEPIDVPYPDDDGYITIHTHTDCSFSFKSSNVRIIQNGLNLEIFRCKYFCNISQKSMEFVFDIFDGHIINKHRIMVQEPRTDGPNLNPAYYISAGYYNEGRSTREGNGVRCGYSMFFVFDIEDTREKSTYSVKQLLDIQPKELVDRIAFYLGCNKSKYEYTLTDFPVIFETKYKGEIPKYLSIHQLKKLYELGVLKIAFEYNYDVYMLSDESFDYIYDLYMSSLDSHYYYKDFIKTFDSKEKMNQFSEKFISNFFKNVL